MSTLLRYLVIGIVELLFAGVLLIALVTAWRQLPTQMKPMHRDRILTQDIATPRGIVRQRLHVSQWVRVRIARLVAKPEQLPALGDQTWQ